MVRLLRRDDRSEGCDRQVDARVWNEVGLELGQVDVERAVEAERGGQGRDDLSRKAVKVGVRRTLNVKVATADVIEGLVVNHKGHIGVLEECVRGEHAIVRLDDGSRDLRCRVDCEGHLRLAAVVHRKALKEECAKARAGAAANGVEGKETLEASAIVRQLANAVEDEVDNLLAHSVVATGVVVGGVLLTRDELLRV
eukprot:scaffold101400_cov30-Tisochrysis_lutea.AAC.1